MQSKRGDLSKAAVLFERYHRKYTISWEKCQGIITAEDLTQTVFEINTQQTKI